MGNKMEAKGNTAQASDRSVIKYFRDVRGELRKVIWPTPKQTLSFTGFTVFLTIFVALAIVLLDAIFNLALSHFV